MRRVQLREEIFSYVRGSTVDRVEGKTRRLRFSNIPAICFPLAREVVLRSREPSSGTKYGLQVMKPCAFGRSSPSTVCGCWRKVGPQLPTLCERKPFGTLDL